MKGHLPATRRSWSKFGAKNQSPWIFKKGKKDQDIDWTLDHSGVVSSYEACNAPEADSSGLNRSDEDDDNAALKQEEDDDDLERDSFDVDSDSSDVDVAETRNREGSPDKGKGVERTSSGRVAASRRGDAIIQCSQLFGITRVNINTTSNAFMRIAKITGKLSKGAYVFVNRLAASRDRPTQ